MMSKPLTLEEVWYEWAEPQRERCLPLSEYRSIGMSKPNRQQLQQRLDAMHDSLDQVRHMMKRPHDDHEKMSEIMATIDPEDYKSDINFSMQLGDRAVTSECQGCVELLIRYKLVSHDTLDQVKMFSDLNTDKTKALYNLLKKNTPMHKVHLATILPILVGVKAKGSGALAKVAKHPLYTIDALRAVLALSRLPPFTWSH
jgi:hypothetical protein